VRRAKNPLAALFLTVFVDLVGFGILIPLQPYLALEFGASKSGVTGLNWAYSAAQLFMAPVWGRLSDRIGRRPILMLSIGGSIFTQALFGATQLFHHGLPDWAGLALLYAARIGAGACGANVSTAQAYVADTTTPANRAKGMGLIGAAFGLGFIVGPALGGGLDRFGHAVPLFFAAGLSTVNLFLVWERLPETVKPGQAPSPAHRAGLRDLWRALRAPGLGSLLLIQLAMVWAFSNMESTLALMVNDRFAWTAGKVGGLFAFAGVVLVIVQGGLVGRFSRRFGERALLAGGIVLEGVGIGLLPYLGLTVPLFAGVGLLAAGNGFANPSISSLISRHAAADRQGGTLGVAASMSSLGRIFGPAWGGFAYDRWNYSAPYLSAAAVLALTFVFCLVTWRRLQPQPSSAPV
jgi:MFS transporter, DHA1 family, tetracycline resistance protein